ncbi:hypothetical protein D3C71_2212060 [compost metagenome]
MRPTNAFFEVRWREELACFYLFHTENQSDSGIKLNEIKEFMVVGNIHTYEEKSKQI